MIDHETPVRAALTRHLRKPGVLPASFQVFRYEPSQFTGSGHPDIGVIGNWITSYLEVKYAGEDGKLRRRGLQDLTMKRLGNITHAYYVVYWLTKTGKETHIVRPSHIDVFPNGERYCVEPGFNHVFVARFIRAIHDSVSL